MACTIFTNEEKETIGVACGSPWGIGVYDTGDEEFGLIYGFPPKNLDPHDFSPDYESCSEEEIASWELAKQACTVH